MSVAQKILIKSLVKPYYRQNAGLLAFLFFIMVFAVGRANEAGLLEYHYSLIKGMLTNQVIFILVLIAWLLYAVKCQQFVTRSLRSKEFSYLNLLTFIKTNKIYGLLLLVQSILFLPVSLYMLVIVGVGFHEHWYLQSLLVIFYILGISLISARWYLYLLRNPGANPFILGRRIPSWFFDRFYWAFFIRYTLTNRKLLFIGIKTYSCGTLYLMLLNQNLIESDMRMIFLFFSFGLLGHGVLFHQFREMEETRLNFYRGLPVTLFARWVQYSLLYLLIFTPEIVTIKWVTPTFLHYADAWKFVFFGYSLLLLLNSLLFIKSFKRFTYLKIVVGIFFLVYIAVLTGSVLWLSGLFFSISIYIFFFKYYRFER